MSVKKMFNLVSVKHKISDTVMGFLSFIFRNEDIMKSFFSPGTCVTRVLDFKVQNNLETTYFYIFQESQPRFRFVTMHF